MSTDLKSKLLTAEFRAKNGLGKTEPIRLTSLLMKLNIQTFFKDVDEKISGMSIKSGEDMFMLINSNKPMGRQHFTICHELYHLFYEENFESNICTIENGEKPRGKEKIAAAFASNLLLPEEGIIGLIPHDELSTNKINLLTILKIEQYYSCSRAALLSTLKRMRLITALKYNEFNQNVIHNAKRYGYSTELYEPGNRNKIIGNYAEKAKRLYDSGKISLQNYITIMRDAGIEEASGEEDEQRQ
jgi:Zn-dependent peptidase ImmA (M78 family)